MSIEVHSKGASMPGLSSLASSTPATGHNQRKFPSEPTIDEQMGPQLLWKVQNRPDQHPLVLYHPYDVKFVDSDLIVVEGFWPYSRIQFFNGQGKSKLRFAQGQVLPFGVTLTTQGQIAVTDHRERTVKFFSADGQSIGAWDSDCFSWPNGIATDHSGHLIVADWSAGLLSINTVEGQNMGTIHTSLNNNSNCSCPQYVTVDLQHRIIMTDSCDHSVKIFSPEGDLLKQFGHQGPGQISDPRGVLADSRGNFIVADWGANCVKKYSPDGQFIQDVLDNRHVQNPWGLAQNDVGLLALTEQKLNASPALKLFEV